ncbi:MAG: SNARE associated Golgi protein [Rhodospirillales bacterium RIFCSPLOWO2_12_FULL_58_28]|nr:MAG: SNARE associated Golgi protein [Rhodospirillales bacterium RIFCSPLOWO2_02_FULL_58_16]OHC77737.1 MAG: SNARE associated Golgi protein [Rhodospirillales bacterium RIFCSPLOWO2_12_FULL_58_28]
MNLNALFRGLIMIASLVAFGFLLKTAHLDKAWIDAEIRGHGAYGDLLFIAVGVLFTGFGLPRQIIGFLGGYAFGFAYGTALAMLASVISCVASFFYARLLGREFVASRFPAKIRSVDDFLHDNPLAMALLIRLLPVGNNLVVNLAAGVSGVRAIPFFLGSAIGYIPQTIVFALAGSGMDLDPELRISLSVALFVLSGIIGVHLYRKHRHGKTFDKDIETKLGEER